MAARPRSSRAAAAAGRGALRLPHTAPRPATDAAAAEAAPPTRRRRSSPVSSPSPAPSLRPDIAYSPACRSQYTVTGSYLSGVVRRRRPVLPGDNFDGLADRGELLRSEGGEPARQRLYRLRVWLVGDA